MFLECFETSCGVLRSGLERFLFVVAALGFDHAADDSGQLVGRGRQALGLAQASFHAPQQLLHGIRQTQPRRAELDSLTDTKKRSQITIIRVYESRFNFRPYAGSHGTLADETLPIVVWQKAQ